VPPAWRSGQRSAQPLPSGSAIRRPSWRPRPSLGVGGPWSCSLLGPERQREAIRLLSLRHQVGTPPVSSLTPRPHEPANAPAAALLPVSITGRASRGSTRNSGSRSALLLSLDSDVHVSPIPPLVIQVLKEKIERVATLHRDLEYASRFGEGRRYSRLSGLSEYAVRRSKVRPAEPLPV